MGVCVGILTWVVLGGLAGWVASIILRRNGSMGVIANIAAGVGGALLGGFVMSALGGSDVTGFNLYSFLVALAGAIVVILIVTWLMSVGRKKTT